MNCLNYPAGWRVETLSYEIDALQVMLPAAMRAKYEKFIIVEEPERIEDADFKAFLAGRKRVPLKEADSAELMKTLKKLCEPRDCHSRYSCRPANCCEKSAHDSNGR